MTDPKENATKKFINDLTDYLKENKLKEVLNLFEDNSYDNIIQESSWYIVPIVSSHLTNENTKYNAELIECCTKILNIIVEKCNPSETVLELLEQVEGPEIHVKFCIVLKVLNKCLNKMNDKMKAIEWCSSTIRSYVDSLPIPDKDSPSSTITINKIQNIYIAIISFLEPLVEEARLENSEKCATLKDYLASILIFLMGKPLSHLPEKCLKQPMPEKIVTLVSQITGDLLWFLNIVNLRCKRTNSKKKRIEEECHNLKVTLFELDENISDLAYANFYFYVITRIHLWERVPQVYDFQYIFQACIYLIIKLLEDQETVAKGLSLMDQLLKRLIRRSLTSELLELNIYLQLFDTITKLMICYFNNNKERKRALIIFQEYVEMFDMQARYLIVFRLYQTSKYSGLLSLTTGIVKDSVIECLQSVPLIPYFLGNNLESLIKLACKLPHGSASDLVELSDEIITSLNLLRFLFIRDQQNQTGIWNLVDKLEKDYLKPLREGIYLCRAHWKVKVKDVEEQKKAIKANAKTELERNDIEAPLPVGGEKLSPIPILNKLSLCYQAVNGLDVMESILIRVNECIMNNPLK
ncbi:glomulin [Osmia bicornis bicornis]|uniref:glomulin n=1 Tax=Osmia bicornis bicornis TaxID=1437191 RepID=UPI0010F8818E|nr:glomulin [Osmia bicornis bicornis]